MNLKANLKTIWLSMLKCLIGVRLVDQRTGEVIGKVVVLPWNGKLRLVGLNGVMIRPHFMAQQRETYWAQDLGFSSHPAPDFPYIENDNRNHFASVATGSTDDVPDVAGAEL